MKRAAVFLDRDGTLIEDQHYPKDPNRVQLIDGVITALLELTKKGYLLFVVSNQSGVGRGIISDVQFQQVHDRVARLFQEAGVQIEEFAYCFHKPEDACQCRKPETALVRALADTHHIDLSKSFVIGDKWCDVQLGFRSSGVGILLRPEYPDNKPEELNQTEFPWFKDWASCAEFIPPSRS